jgi:putative flippase GtrA
MSAPLVVRWLKFNGAGLAGVAVQLAALTVLTHFGVGYLAATLLAVECAVLHNFFWHERWTWRERAEHTPQLWSIRLLRFHLANGLVSLLGNWLLMAWLVGILGGPVLVSNLIAIVLCGTANFVAGDLYVFRAEFEERPPQRR